MLGQWHKESCSIFCPSATLKSSTQYIKPYLGGAHCHTFLNILHHALAPRVFHIQDYVVGYSQLGVGTGQPHSYFGRYSGNCSVQLAPKKKVWLICQGPPARGSPLQQPALWQCWGKGADVL